jgi:hypothetical protein
VTDAPLAEVDGEIVPQGAVAQETDQLMPRLAGSLSPADTVVVVPASTVLLPSKYENATVAGTVIVVEAETEESLTDVAVMFTARSATGLVGGDVYVAAAPLTVVAGDTEPHGAAAQETLHCTPRLEVSLLTVAVTCAVPPGWIVG